MIITGYLKGFVEAGYTMQLWLEEEQKKLDAQPLLTGKLKWGCDFIF